MCVLGKKTPKITKPNHHYWCYACVTAVPSVHNSGVEAALTLHDGYPDSLCKAGRKWAERHRTLPNKGVARFIRQASMIGACTQNLSEAASVLCQTLLPENLLCLHGFSLLFFFFQNLLIICSAGKSLLGSRLKEKRREISFLGCCSPSRVGEGKAASLQVAIRRTEINGCWNI